MAVSLEAWARHKEPADLTLDLVLALILFALAIPILSDIYAGKAAAPVASPKATQKASTQIAALRQAIVGQESGGHCETTNHSGSGAAGLAQVMPENIAAWSREAIGREVSLSEFLKDCGLQVRVVDFKLAQYWQEEAQTANESMIVRRVAARWYAGRATLYDSAAPQYWNGTSYPSVRDYTLLVLERYQRHRFT